MKLLLLLTLVAAPCVFAASSEKSDSRSRESSISYISAAIPKEIYRCLKNYKLVRCMKWFLLSRMDSQSANYPNTGNITADVLQQFLSNKNDRNLINYAEAYKNLSDSEINTRLFQGLQKFFDNRVLMLQVIPGVIVKVTPNNQNTLDFSLKKVQNNLSDGNINDARRRKHNYAHLVHVGLPILLLPAFLFVSILPILIPALKLITIFSTVFNFSTLLAAVMLLARQSAIEQEQKQAIYFNGGVDHYPPSPHYQ